MNGMKRISDQYRFFRNDQRLHQARVSADQAQQIAASGLKMRNVSDQPVLFPNVVKNDTRQANLEQFQKTRVYARGFLSTTEDTLREMIDSIVRVQELTIQQINAPWDAESRKMVAREVKELMEHVISLGNKRFLENYIFAGFRNHVPPLSAEGLYHGDDGEILLQVGEGQIQAINIPGSRIFGEKENPYETGVLGALKRILRGLETNETRDLTEGLNALNQSHEELLSIVSTVGSRLKRLQVIDDHEDLSLLRIGESQQGLIMADPITAAADLKKAEHTLQYILEASGKFLNQTLVHYL